MTVSPPKVQKVDVFRVPCSGPGDLSGVQALIDAATSRYDVAQRYYRLKAKLLGLDKDWMVKALKAVGNYGEMFERNVGPKSALNLPRGLNNQWNKGGLQYAPPIR